MGGFIDNVSNFLDKHIKNVNNSIVYNNFVLNKPIGIRAKNFHFMESMLNSNIGSHQFKFDGFGTNIGMISNPYLNSETEPWFNVDESKKKYDSYLSYVNDMYFNGTMSPFNTQNINDLYNNNGIVSDFNSIGVVRSYNIDSDNISTNPNGYNDTRMGVINNFYLKTSLRKSYDQSLLRKTSSYHNPSYGVEENVVKESRSITQGAYSKFGLKGVYGINTGMFSLKEDGVVPQNLYTDDIILWSTSDNFNTKIKNSNPIANGINNIVNGVCELFDEDKKYLYLSYSDNPFGNFYSLSYSLGLLVASGDKTKEFISKSIYGIDLMSDYVPSLDYKDGDALAMKFITRKKYFALIDSRGTNYVDAITNGDVSYEQNELDNIVRLKFNNPGNDNLYTFNTYLVYSESEGNKESVQFDTDIIGNNGTIINKYQTYDDKKIEKEDIISYTNRHFQKNKFKTIIGRLHTDSYDSVNDVRSNKDLTSTAISQYGMSRGRNLLKKNHKNGRQNGFEDPYCRVWTYHKQYSKYSDLIRPFASEDLKKLNQILGETYQVNRKRLVDYGVKDENGLLRIAPKREEGNKIKSYMFSIENLAWKNSKTMKDAFQGNTSYMEGPNGGRIMWFPPYGLTFQESSKANWNSSQFIGRGEKIYSYVDTERSGSLSFTMLIDHPSLLNSVNNVNADTIGDVDDVKSVEQQILRFFAGSDILENIKKEKKNNKNKISDLEPINKDNTIENFKIEFDIYFPFGYSGKDFKHMKWYDYLLNGVGGIFIEDECEIYLNENSSDIIGGYEMDSDEGLSCINKWDKYPPDNLYDSTEGLLSVVYYKSKNSSKKVKKELYTYVLPNENGDVNHWGYLIDDLYGNIVFEKSKQYLDNKSYHLNSSISKKNQEDEECLKVSFADFAIFNGVKCSENKKNNITTTTNQDLLKSLLDEYKIDNIEINSYSIIDEKLAQNRANAVQEWLKSNKIFKDVNFKTKSVLVGEENDNVDVEELLNSLNKKASKSNRKVNVVINLCKGMIDLDMEQNNDSETIVQENSNNTNNLSTRNKSMNEILSLLGNNVDKLNLDIEENNQEGDNVITYNEYDFFQKIKMSDSFFKNKVLSKIKYFDPAYHSITPEGFNSRLTFLHQCTRQGPTNSFKDNNVNVKNLSFGQPPICILRIGDFYNTKIIIDSVNIKYDEATWDLNDEGIGVMPMMAQVDISFNFIGGSDLSGAVDILQNAVSFNYYANTSVYESKSTKVINKRK